MKKAFPFLALIAVVPFLAACAGDAGDSTQATDAQSGVISLTTESAAAVEHFEAGMYARDMAKLSEANSHFEAAAAADPDFAVAYLMAANTAVSTAEFTSNLARAVELSSDASEAEQLWIEVTQRGVDADVEGQLAAAEEMTRVVPASPRAWMTLAAVQSGGFNNDVASRANLMFAIEKDPSLAATHMQLGNNFLFVYPKDFARAAEQFQHAIDLAPDEANPYDLMGDAHRAMGDLEAAYDDYTMAAERAPDLGSPLQQRGHVNSFLGNYEEARADYTRAMELEVVRGYPQTAAFYSVFRAYVNIHAGDPEAAIAELQEFYDTADDMGLEDSRGFKINALTNIAQIAVHYGDYETAAEALQARSALQRAQAEEVGTESIGRATEANIAYFEGLLAARQGDVQTAQAKATEITELRAGDANPRKMEQVHEILGMADFSQGNYAGAADNLAQAAPGNVYARYYRAVALAEAGDAEAAGEIFDELAVYNFNGPGYAMTRADILERAGE
jgi:tetratricopeptide (TPR) repeat protein